MRVGHKYAPAGVGRTSRDRTPAEFTATMGAAPASSREEFLATMPPLAAELLPVLAAWLDRRERILSVASGRAVHEVSLRLDGYDMTASDFADDLLAPARALFPELPTATIDLLAPYEGDRFDVVLAVDVDYAFDGRELASFLANTRLMLREGGRLIVGHTYRDTGGTRLIDDVLLPAWAWPRLHGRRPSELPLVRREHGFRRSDAEVVAAAGVAGFTVGRRRGFGWAVELQRVGLDLRFPRAYRAAVAASRLLRVFHYGTLLEFETSAPAGR